jgi:hypothetical protein
MTKFAIKRDFPPTSWEMRREEFYWNTQWWKGRVFKGRNDSSIQMLREYVTGDQ